MNKCRKLYETVNIRRITLKNRIAMALMGINYFCDNAGTFARNRIEYYAERGGVGLIITGVFKVVNTIEPEQPNGKTIAG